MNTHPWYKTVLFTLALALLTACGSQNDANMPIAGVNTSLLATNSIANTSPETTSTPLLDSLAKLYPSGQLPADRAATSAQDLLQNPAALKRTAEIIAPAASSDSQKDTQVAPAAVAADYAPVQRIQNTTLYGAYFFSIYPGEVSNALALNPHWKLEGPAFWTSRATGTDLHPVHRFQNKLNGSYLYTIYDPERADIVANYSATFAYEGIAWYARQTPATGWSTLWRFRNLSNGTYLFSAFESEKDAIVRDYPQVFKLEGPAYYVRQDAQADPVTPPVVPPVVVQQPIAAGGDHTCAIKTDSTVSCWGYNGTGQLGNGSTLSEWVPTAVPGLTGVAALTAAGYISAGYSGGHTCALKTDGTVSCWGWNHLGQLGDGTTLERKTPTAVPSLMGVGGLTSGYGHTCALKTDGTVSCWGDNSNGQLGDGTIMNRNVPTAVTGLNGVKALTANGSHTCALKTDGTVSCWGGNASGQLGNGNTADSWVPTAVPGLTGVKALAAGLFHTCALKTDGTVGCWGANFYGQLGDGTLLAKKVPTTVPGLSRVIALVANVDHTCAHISGKAGDYISCWGYNVSGQLGDGTTVNRSVPTTVSGFTGVNMLAAGGHHTCALKTDGTARCWGNNYSGQLGDGTSANRLTPTAVTGGPLFWR